MRKLLLLNFILTGLFVINPLIFTYIFDNANKNNLLPLLAVLTGIYFLQYLLGIFVRYKCENYSFDRVKGLKKKAVLKIMNFSYEYSQNFSYADAMEVLEKDMNIVHSFYNKTFFNIFNDLVRILLILAVLMFKNPYLGGAFAAIIFIIFLILKGMKVDYTVLGEERSYSNKVTQFILSVLNMRDEIQIMERFDFISLYLKKAQKVWEKLQVKSQYKLYLSWAVAVFSFGMFYMILLLITGEFVKSSILQLSTIYLIMRYSQMLLGPIEMTQVNYQGYQKYKTSIQRYNDFITQEDESSESKKDLLTEITEIDLKNASCHFDSTEVFSDLSFTIKAPYSLGVYGESGCGKSTLFKAIGKRIPLQGGCFLYNGVDSENVSLSEVNRYLAYVENSSFIFRGTILENILMFSKDQKEESVLNVLIETGLFQYYKNFTGMENFLSAELDPENSDNSLKQLINITRYFFSDLDVYIFDEALASVKPETEAEINNIILDYFSEKIVIIVSHQRSGLEKCDKCLDFNTINKGVFCG